MNHVMLDLETMGNGSNAAIIAIGACYFDPNTGEIGDTFYSQVSLESSVDAGLEIDSSTVLWWMKQDYEARAKFHDNDSGTPLPAVLPALSDFLTLTDDVKVWGNGAIFDNTILKNAYKACKREVPWGFRNNRDVRTIVELGQQIGIDPKKDLEFEGVPHYALDDAKHQARYVSAIWQALTAGK